MNFKKIMITLGICSTLILGACGNQGESSEEHATHVSGDIHEETKSVNDLPQFLADKPEDMKTIYAAVAKHQELLEHIPCYCGCGESANHKDNYDCFIYENKENGAVVWDDHGTKCGVCLEIAAQSVIDFQNGKSIKEIRQDIDKKYEKGYAKPTPTPQI